MANQTIYPFGTDGQLPSDIGVINDLTTGGADKALSAEMGKRLKAKVDEVQANTQRLYNNLGNIAFWDSTDQAAAAPTAIDWSVPKKILSITNNISNSVIILNGEPVSSQIMVDQGESVEFIVAGATGYNVTSVTASSGTATNLGNGTFKVVITVNDNTTLTLTGTTAVKTYSIGYTLTGCGAPSGVTNPTTIQHGGTATIQLEATITAMPASLPNGAVTGATAAYTRDSQDNTKATIVLSNVTDDVSVSVAAIQLEFFAKKLMDISNNRYFIQSGNVTINKRATLLCARSSVANPCTWNVTGAVDPDTATMAAYTTFPIPSGATKVSMQCNSAYYYGLILVNSNGAAQNAVEWTLGSTKKELNFASYPNATHIAVNFKIGSAGTTDFSTETYESMGIDFKIS